MMKPLATGNVVMNTTTTTHSSLWSLMHSKHLGVDVVHANNIH